MLRFICLFLVCAGWVHAQGPALFMGPGPGGSQRVTRSGATLDEEGKVSLQRLTFSNAASLTLDPGDDTLDPPNGAGTVLLTADAGGNNLTYVDGTGFVSGSLLLIVVADPGSELTVDSGDPTSANEVGLPEETSFVAGDTLLLRFNGVGWNVVSKSVPAVVPSFENVFQASNDGVDVFLQLPGTGSFQFRNNVGSPMFTVDTTLDPFDSERHVEVEAGVHLRLHSGSLIEGGDGDNVTFRSTDSPNIVGMSLSASTGSLQLSVPIAQSPITHSSVDSPVTLNPYVATWYYANTAGGGITYNLPTCDGGTSGVVYHFKIIAGANIVTLDPAGAQTIEGGAATYDFSGLGVSHAIQCQFGVGWWVH